jgi:hypothetical protein
MAMYSSHSEPLSNAGKQHFATTQWSIVLAKCQVADDRLTLTAFLARAGDKPVVFRRWPQAATRSQPRSSAAKLQSPPKP